MAGRRVTQAVLAVAAIATTMLGAGCKAEYDPKPPVDAVRHLDGVVGTPVDYFGVTATVMAIEPFDQTNDAFPRFRVAMRTENTRPAPWVNPEVRVRCKESTDRGEWYKGSTWESAGILPGGTVNEGQVIVGFPRKSNTDLYPVPTCTDAAIVVTGTDPLDRRRSIVTAYALDPTVVQQAIDAPRA